MILKCILIFLFQCQIISTTANVTLHFVGDINFDGAPQFYHRQGTCRYPNTFANVVSLFNQSDLVIGNLESPFVSEIMKSDGQFEFSPLLGAEPVSAEALRFARFGALSLANNHLNDYKSEPVNYTMSILRENGIHGFGITTTRHNNEQPQIPLIIKRGGLTIGILGYCSAYKRLFDLSTGDISFYRFCAEKRKGLNVGPAIYSESSSARDVKLLKGKVDVIVVMMHWGEEYTTTPSTEQKNQANHLQAIGVHLVIGAHPHVLQGHTHNKQSLVVYSLGNFLFGPKYTTKLFYQNPNPSKKMMEGFENLMKTTAEFDNSMDSRIVRVNINRQGVVNAEYMPLRIELDNESKCLQPTPLDNEKWVQVCGPEDKACLNFK